MSDNEDLFLRDPLSLTDEDIDAMILKYRERRASFKASPAEFKKKQTASAPKLTEGQQAALKLADQIDIDI